MHLYHYDRDNGIYLGTRPAREDPMQPGTYLVPAHATTIAPPATVKGKVAAFDGAAWTVIDEPPPEDLTAPSDTDGPLDPIIADLIEAVTATGADEVAAKQRLTAVKTARKPKPKAGRT